MRLIASQKVSFFQLFQSDCITLYDGMTKSGQWKNLAKNSLERMKHWNKDHENTFKKWNKKGELKKYSKNMLKLETYWNWLDDDV